MNQPAPPSLTLNSENTLRNRSSIATAIRLWETPSIKNEIRKFGGELLYKDVKPAYDQRSTWNRICDKVLGELKALTLPVELIQELEEIIPCVGDKVFLWTVYVIKEFQFDFKYSQQILWTPNGLIDETKIYQDIWRNDPIFPGISNETINKIALYSLACIHANESFINRNLKDMVNVIQPYTENAIKDVNNVDVNQVMTVFLIYYFSSKSHTLSFNFLYKALSSPEYPTGLDQMFIYCAIYGFDKAAEYFYKQLKPEDREGKVLAAASESVRNAFEKINFNYEKGRLPEALLYLLNKIPSEAKKKFLSREIIDVFTMFFFTWPYQDFCIPILDYVWNDLSPHTKTDLVKRAFDVYKKFRTNRHTAYKSVLMPVLMHLSKKAPKSFKKYFKNI